LISCTLTAFACARMNFKGKNFMFVCFLSTTRISIQVILAPSYQGLTRLHWLDPYPGKIVPFIAHVFGAFMIRQAFIAIPRELEEAA
jgi:ABC-type glycerol-3-phosphate transport system permease component